MAELLHQPFATLRVLVPGIRELRSPTRATAIAQLLLVTLSALGLDRGQNRHLLHVHAGCGEVQREQSPDQAVVQVVDHARLATRG